MSFCPPWAEAPLCDYLKVNLFRKAKSFLINFQFYSVVMFLTSTLYCELSFYQL